jgi:AAA ATPase domain
VTGGVRPRLAIASRGGAVRMSVGGPVSAGQRWRARRRAVDTGGMSSLGEVIDGARRGAFVGRRAQLADFGAALAGESPRRVLFLHGPGGIGKTTLLLELRARAREAGWSVALLDGRELDPAPEGFAKALAAAPEVGVLLVDGYEHLGPIDGWLRRELVPSLPADAVVVLAGRDEPAPAWRTEPGWRQVVAVHGLDQLDDTDAAELLARAGVAGADQARLVRLGRGHPLALALLADAARAGTVPDRLADAPDIIGTLLASLLREAPSQAHMTGLATCTKSWLTTEDLLRRTVGDADAPAVWEWLARRPFVLRRPDGLRPHDLTRDVLDAEFQRRSPERYRALHRTIHDHVLTAMRAAAGLDKQLLAQHFLFLHRHSPLTAAFYELRERGSAAVVPARPDEHELVVSIVDRALGPDAAGLARAWCADAPDGLVVVRAAGGVAGFAFHLFCPTGSPLERDDPVVAAILAHVAATAPTRDGERVNVARFFGGAAAYQRDPYAVLAGGTSSIIEWCTRPLAATYVVITDPDYWAPFFDYLAFRPVLDLEVGGQRHLVYGQDWRRFGVQAWLDLMNDREHGGGTGPPPDALLAPPPLDRDTFAAAVRAALPALARPRRLADSPLADSPLVGTRLGADAPAVRARIEAAVEALAADPRTEHLRAVLRRTYVRPAPTQEAAAEALGLPFSTYRRHLGKAVDAVADALWRVEVSSD